MAAALLLAGTASTADAPRRTRILLDPAGWKAQAPLPLPVSHHRAVAVPRAVIVTGGQDRHGRLQRGVFRAPVAANADLKEWTREADLPEGVADHGFVESGGRLFVTGGVRTGTSGPVHSDEVWMAQPDADGRIRRWDRAGRMPEALSGHGAAALGGRLYVAGGLSTAGYRNGVWTADAPAGGRPGPWRRVTSLPVPLAHAALISVSSYLVVVGGQSPGEGKTLVMPTVYVGPVFPDGSVPTWYLATAKLPGAWLGFGRNQVSLVSWRRQLFGFGGQDALWFLLDSIIAAEFDAAQGETGPWGVQTGAAEMHQLTAAAVRGDHVYLTGGTIKGEVTAKVTRGRFVEEEIEE